MELPEIENDLRHIGRELDKLFKKIWGEHTGFCLVTFKFGEIGISHYISNADRKEMLAGLKDMIESLEKGADIPAAHPTKQ